MGELILFFRGYGIVTITGASPDWALNRLAEQRIPIWGMVWKDPFTVEVRVFLRDIPAIRQISERTMCQVSAERSVGLRASLRGAARPVLLIWFVFTAAMAVMLPQYLLFFEVTGNETISSAKILQELEKVGVSVGIRGTKVKPKWIKDHILSLMPELQWITVTQKGCMAQVIVRERLETPEIVDRKGFSNIVASKAGLIISQSILSGQSVKQVGDIVTQGELLVSGAVDLERVVTLTHAQAEIFARTWTEQIVIMPRDIWKKTSAGESWRTVWLEFGKERIKIFGNSGISTASCDKMIVRKQLSLPGGNQLPVSVLIETYTPYELTPAVQKRQQVRAQLSRTAREEVLSRTQAGTLLQASYDFHLHHGVYELRAVLECSEMIAQAVEANWNEEELRYDGTNGKRGTNGADH